MHFLMNKDTVVGYIEIQKGELGSNYTFQPKKNIPLPIGFKSIDTWLENRKASKHNSHLRQIMRECGCEQTEGFIKITHAASINDTFWVKSDNEDIVWSQVSFYTNRFDETISKLAFEGLELYGLKLSHTSPELSTEGSFRKCWIRENDSGIYLYKRGGSDARNMGLEPYCEVMASEIAAKLLGHKAVEYELANLHHELASKCLLFTDEKYGYTPVSRFDINSSSADTLLSFYRKIGCEDEFRRMLVLDAITFNTDRHSGNHGVLVENSTQKPIKMAPVFDFNLSLLPYIEEDDMTDIGTTLEKYTPCIGNDFTRIGQTALTSSIRSDLIGLKGFKFSFQGDSRFTHKRVAFIETLINRQIDAILSKDVLYTHDVFIPKRRGENIEKSKEEILSEKIWTLSHIEEYFAAYDFVEESPYSYMTLFPKQDVHKEIQLNLSTGDIFIFADGEKLDSKINEEVYTEFNELLKLVKNAFDKANV